MNMLHLSSPWETEMGSAGEQPVKGYHGQAHQTMRGRGVQLASRPTQNPHRMIDLLCLKKRKNLYVNLCPGNRARHTIAGPDRKFVYAKAEVQGNQVAVWNDAVKSPAAVRYGWDFAPECNLYNAAGLPASPFRTDDWPGITPPKASVAKHR